MALENIEFPRPLNGREINFLSSILPNEREVYKKYRSRFDSLVVIGEGRRGNGEIILGEQSDTPNFDEPLAPVFAYGMIETDTGTISVTAREYSLQQISIEIVHNTSNTIPEQYTELRRWTYSTWQPGKPCPQCMQAVREVQMVTSENHILQLAICRTDKRLWVYNSEEQYVLLVPITNYYNELMLNKNIRDPKIALDSKNLFADLMKYTDGDLTRAFFTYNKLKSKLRLRGELKPIEAEPSTFFTRMKRIFK